MLFLREKEVNLSGKSKLITLSSVVCVGPEESLSLAWYVSEDDDVLIEIAFFLLDWISVRLMFGSKFSSPPILSNRRL